MEQEPQFDAEAEAYVRAAIASCADEMKPVNWHREFTRSQADLEMANQCIRLLQSQSDAWQSQARTAGIQVDRLTTWLTWAIIACAVLALVIGCRWIF